MKFEDFYNQVFIAEKDEEVRANVASPEDMDDVEPLPLPPTPDPTSPTPTGGNSASTLSEYINKIVEFSESLNNDSGECLNSLCKKLDVPGTPYADISAKTATTIVRVTGGLGDLVQVLIDYNLKSAAGAPKPQA
jgi:hypothetical protein